MLDKLFNNKKFLFVFSFCMQSGLYLLLEHTINGPAFSPDLGLIPIFGLMFGPVGALGQGFASLAMGLYIGSGIIPAILDFAICSFASILTYKLWYSKIGKREISAPKFDSSYALMKFILIMFIVSNIFFTLLYFAAKLSYELSSIYVLTIHSDFANYSLNMFLFSLVFGLLLISIFNMLKIPLQYPKKWANLLNIDNKYFLYAYIVLFAYSFFVAFLNGTPLISEDLFVDITLIVSILFFINKMDMEIKIKDANYKLIEQIILTFLLILAITLFVTFNNFRLMTNIIFDNASSEFSIIATLSYSIVLIIILSLIHIYHIEQTITNPIYDLIDAMNKNNPQMEIYQESELDSGLQDYLDRDDNISRLVNSFKLLKNNILSYLTQIKEASAENERIETEFSVASKIQSNMLKTDFEEFSNGRNFEICGFMNPTKEVGGDFYDFFDIDDENIGFVIGDVCGKGIPATLFMVKTMYLIRNHNKIHENLEKAISSVNKLSCERNDENLFVTAFYGKLNLNSGKLSLVNAGHNPPLIKRSNEDIDKNKDKNNNNKYNNKDNDKDNDKDKNNNKYNNNDIDNDNDNDKNTFEYLNTPPNFLIGVMEKIEYERQDMNMNPGDIIFLYTDGITDAINHNQEIYGEERLMETLNAHKDKSLEEMVEGIKKDVYDFSDGEDQFDDMTMLIIKYTGCGSNE